VPLLDGVACAVGLAEHLARLGLPKPRAGSYAAVPPRQVDRVDAPLAALLRGEPPA
jgi:allantoin racemase